MKTLAAVVTLVLLAGCASPAGQHIRRHADIACATALFMPTQIGLPVMLLCPFWIDAIPEAKEEDLDV